MRRKREKTRLAMKTGWHDGNSGGERKSYPYKEMELCYAYDNAYHEGKTAGDDRNPYGMYADKQAEKMGWYIAKTGKAHFFRESSSTSQCGVRGFDGSEMRVCGRAEEVPRCRLCVK